MKYKLPPLAAIFFGLFFTSQGGHGPLGLAPWIRYCICIASKQVEEKNQRIFRVLKGVNLYLTQFSDLWLLYIVNSCIQQGTIAARRISISHTFSWKSIHFSYLVAFQSIKNPNTSTGVGKIKNNSERK